MNRDRTIDNFRGLAIAFMLLSNLAGEILQLPHPTLLRILGSSAAPIFILVSGYMLGISIQEQKHSKTYFLIRGIFLLLLAGLIDFFLWKILPFFWFDVLYLIGISIVVVSLFNSFSFFYCSVIAISFLLLAPILQKIFGYLQAEYFEWENFSQIGTYLLSLNVGTFLNQWFISGWFPIFPWLGVFVLGVGVSEKRNLHQNLFSEKRLIVMGFLFFTGISIWNYEPKLENRGGYSEFFYPPTVSYFLVYLSISYFLFIVVEKYFSKVPVLHLLGESSLFSYLAHLGIIRIVKNFLPKELEKVNVSSFVLLFVASLICLILLVWILKQFKPYTKKIPFPFNMIFQ